jgi:hypothetical protein
MKIVVYGPEKRTGILSGSEVVDARSPAPSC